MSEIAQTVSLQASRYRLAVGLVLASSALNSVSGLIVRSVEQATDWQIVFYRSLGLSSGILLFCLLRYRGGLAAAFRGVGPWGLFGGLLVAVATTGFVHAITRTTVANTLFILSALPFITAVLGYIFLGEKVRRGTWIAMAFALCGMAVMVAGGISAGALSGNLIALFTACCFAGFVVVLRRGKHIDMLPVALIGSLLAMAGAALGSGGELAAPGREILTCFAWGALLNTLVHGFFIHGSKHVQGAEITLLILIEFVLGPVWVWLVVNEVPSAATLLGGAVIMAAVAGRAITGMRPRTPAAKL
jgi:drug/metabolite transporter (DMT)-like permease